MNLKENNAFCILPWLHLDIKHNGDVYPCCRQTGGFRYGSIAQNSISEIWNSDTIKEVRKNMLKGQKQNFCFDCHKMESLGKKSYRNTVNEVFKDKVNQVESGSEKITYLDIRFSNVCNLKCRTCNAENSSSWYSDEVKIKNKEIKNRILKVENFNPNIMNEIEELIPNLEYIYFAGGEPLLDVNHYRLLEKILQMGRQDMVISYNSNMSTLSFQHWDVLKLWAQFKRIQISASIDSVGTHMELIRKGADWKTTENNLRLIRAFLPNAFLQIYPTVSVLNCFQLTDLIDYMLENNFIKIENHIQFNVLVEPSYLNIGVLNESENKKLEKHYLDYLEKISSKYPAELISYLRKELLYIVAFSASQGLQKHRQELYENTQKLDQIRGESSAAVLEHIDFKA